MMQMGIAHYATRDTRNFLTRQSEDGYHIIVKFKVRSFVRARRVPRSERPSRTN